MQEVKGAASLDAKVCDVFTVCLRVGSLENSVCEALLVSDKSSAPNPVLKRGSVPSGFI